MENIPGLRVVGRASWEAQEAAKREIEFRLTARSESLSESDRKALESSEYRKTEQDIALIAFANEETNRLRQKLGIGPYNIPPENYHLLPTDLFVDFADDIYSPTSPITAFSSASSQAIMFNGNEFMDNPVYFGSMALHETLHLKGHLTLEVEEDDTMIDQTSYREGVSVLATQRGIQDGKDASHFDGLHEAIVSEQQKQSLPNLLALPFLKKEKERLSAKPAQELMRRISEKENIPFDDVLWVGGSEEEYKAIPYRSQIMVLRYICTEIGLQFPDKYHIPEDIFYEFLKAHFTGRLLPIARMVEGTFGKGSFRVLGEMGTGKWDGVATLKALKQSRKKQVELM